MFEKWFRSRESNESKIVAEIRALRKQLEDYGPLSIGKIERFIKDFHADVNMKLDCIPRAYDAKAFTDKIGETVSTCNIAVADILHAQLKMQKLIDMLARQIVLPEEGRKRPVAKQKRGKSPAKTARRKVA